MDAGTREGPINGDIAVKTLPELWNEKYREVLSIEPATDRESVLQDVHRTSDFCYILTNTRGNVYAAQIFRALKRAFPDYAEITASSLRKYLD